MFDPSLIEPFLQEAGWDGAARQTVGEDWSQRHIIRLLREGSSAILMQSLPDGDPRLTPGHHPGDYVRIANYLKTLGLSVPDIYSAAPEEGLLLVEDLGSENFHDSLTDQDALELYMAATNVLIHLYQTTDQTGIPLPDYYRGHIHTGRRRVIDWYAPLLRQKKNEDGLAECYLAVWDEIEKKLPPIPRRFLHADYHPHNLVWMPDREGIRKIGLIDFQGAMTGPAPYDLANLLQDARRIVPSDITLACMDRFQQALVPQEWDVMSAWYPVLACQFHCRVIGQAIKLAVRDRKTRLLGLVPVLQRHICKDLENPLLAPLARFFDDAGITFDDAPPLDPARLAQLIRKDAF